jgi:hypothetical protein
MRKQYAHLSSQKRGAPNFLIYDLVSRQQQWQATAEIKMVSVVNSHGPWAPATSRNRNKIENPGLVQQEHFKNRKHADLGVLKARLRLDHAAEEE